MSETLYYAQTRPPFGYLKWYKPFIRQPDTYSYQDASGGRALAVVSKLGPEIQEADTAVVVPASWGAGTGEQDQQHFMRAWRVSDRLFMPVINVASHELSLQALRVVKGGNLGPVARQQAETLDNFLKAMGAKNLGRVVVYGPSLGGSGALTYQKTDGTVGGLHDEFDVVGFGAHAPANLASDESPWKRLGGTPADAYARVMLQDPRYRQEYLKRFGLDPDMPFEEAIKSVTNMAGRTATKITLRHPLTNAALGMSLAHDTLEGNVSRFLEASPRSVFIGSRGIDDPVTPEDSFERTMDSLQVRFGKRVVSYIVRSAPHFGPRPADHGLVDDPEIMAHRVREVAQLRDRLKTTPP